MNSCELATFVTATACGIVKCFPKEDLPLITAVFAQLTATLGTILAQQATISSAIIPPVIEPVDDIITTSSSRLSN